jgi:hypothetical protein
LDEAGDDVSGASPTSATLLRHWFETEHLLENADGSFKSAINALTIHETGTSGVEDRIRLKETRPFRTDYRPYMHASKSIFNKVVG